MAEFRSSPPPGEPAVLVSACLLGVRCNHRGQASTSDSVLALSDRHRLVPVCPEVAGGLPTPRPAAEIQGDGRVRTASGDDVTETYRRGAAATLALAQAMAVERAVLKARSPSCGPDEVYDGSFTRTPRAGAGLTAQALRQAGIEVVSEETLGNTLQHERRPAGNLRREAPGISPGPRPRGHSEDADGPANDGR